MSSVPAAPVAVSIGLCPQKRKIVAREEQSRSFAYQRSLRSDHGNVSLRTLVEMAGRCREERGTEVRGGETSPYSEIYYITIHLWLAITPVRWQWCRSGQGVDNEIKAWSRVYNKNAEYRSKRHYKDRYMILFRVGQFLGLLVHIKTSDTFLYSFYFFLYISNHGRVDWTAETAIVSDHTYFRWHCVCCMAKLKIYSKCGDTC